jgi:hypothetical protein
LQQIQQHQNRFPLIGAHAAVDCESCHKGAATGQFKGLSTQCYSCHAKDYQQTTNPNHVTGKFPTTCEQCHAADNWLSAKFDHATTGFPLTGAHVVPPRQCADCHANNNYNLTVTTCVSCHLKDFQGTTNPNHVQSGFTQTCQQCHNTTSWAGATFDHSSTGFPLTGAHVVPPRQCVDCHVNNNYNITVTTCVSCHLKDFQGTTNPNHVQGGFPQTCQQCHSTTSWAGASFDHSTTGFALTGAHTVPPRQCAECHQNNNYNLTSAACASCHLKDYQRTTSPNHVAANFPQGCEQCHGTTSWAGASFNHAGTGFQLTGAHTVPPRQCVDCHVNNNFNLTTSACVSCHLKDFQATTNPNHVQGGFPQTCQQCHSTTSWTGASFDHATTGFPLTGSHTVPPRQCVDCHVANNYNITVTTCVSCHLKDFQGTTNPNHVQSGFPQTCQQCHNTMSWNGATFDHSTTGFALTGSHTVPPRQCVDCHIANNYNITVTTCVSCHLKDFQGTTNPDHVQSGFPQTCQQCHNTTAWTGATFDHSTTGFVLTGAHTVPPRQCVDCHVANNYKITVSTCVSCHLKDFQGTTNPSHVQAGFPQTCDTCHSTASWANAKFDHATTGFALVGAHAVPPRQCVDCHVGNNYNLTTTTCVSCHQNDYNTATSPVNHAQLGFPTTCQLCHDTVAWTNGTFNHNTTAFPLTGAHTVPPRHCVDCHVNNNYTTLPTDCYGCHKTDYQNTTNPNHAAAGFPTTCTTCHTTTSWAGATFNHTWFPQNHGNARVCSDCHTNPSDYSVFSCTVCHAKTTTDQHHQGVRGYVYNSANCYQCHRNGRAG